VVKCRGCDNILTLTFLDLGLSPIANDLITPQNLSLPETYYPLRVMTCTECALVQLPEVAAREALFRDDYVYFSSFSTSWLEHSREYAAKMIEKINLVPSDLVVEVASNDGYLLQYFSERGIQVQGIEPASGVAKIAIEKGIPTLINFFGESVALELANRIKPKLMIGNNVLAHVPNIHDFIEGFAILISDEGLITFEFPHLVNLIRNNQFDTIYHEHYSYLSVTALIPIFVSHELKIIDVEKLSTHGGSLRVYAAKQSSNWKVQDSVEMTVREESDFDPRTFKISNSLQMRTLETKLKAIGELLELSLIHI
jgi:hypothetical protein